jgi:hypothetical protein
MRKATMANWTSRCNLRRLSEELLFKIQYILIRKMAANNIRINPRGPLSAAYVRMLLSTPGWGVSTPIDNKATASATPAEESAARLREGTVRKSRSPRL